MGTTGFGFGCCTGATYELDGIEFTVAGAVRPGEGVFRGWLLLEVFSFLNQPIVGRSKWKFELRPLLFRVRDTRSADSITK